MDDKPAGYWPLICATYQKNQGAGFVDYSTSTSEMIWKCIFPN
jgi:hypothetical protein